jgi:hypothetical protein
MIFQSRPPRLLIEDADLDVHGVGEDPRSLKEMTLSFVLQKTTFALVALTGIHVLDIRPH